MDSYPLLHGLAKNTTNPNKTANDSFTSTGGAGNNDSDHTSVTETEEDESEQEEVQIQLPIPPGSRTNQKVVRWADDNVTTSNNTNNGLTIVHTYDSLPCLSTRVVILLLDLEHRVFEFVQCEFHTDERLVVLDVLRQLPSLASLDRLTQQRYRILCRTGEEMINMLPIQHYNVQEGEILIASSAQGGITPRQVMMAAATLLQEKKLIRAVRKAKLSGRALQKLCSSEELLYGCETETDTTGVAATTALHYSQQSTSFQSSASMEEEVNDMEEEQPEEECGLIVKVLSRELGEDTSINFADFSFPVFSVNEEENEKKSGDDTWFYQLFATSTTVGATTTSNAMDAMVVLGSSPSPSRPPSLFSSTTTTATTPDPPAFSFSMDFVAPLDGNDDSDDNDAIFSLGRTLRKNDGLTVKEKPQRQQLTGEPSLVEEEVPSSWTWSEDDAILKAFATFGR
jgi:hypothetical protein